MAARVLLILAVAANAVVVPSFGAGSDPDSSDDHVVHLATIYCSTREPCEQALAEIIKDGTPFGDVARRYSEDLNATAGGDAGTYALEDLSPTLRDAIKHLQPGEISGLVETDRGFHLLKIKLKIGCNR